MSRDEKLHVIVAETAPIICSGFINCLKRLPGLQVQPIEVHNMPDLIDGITTTAPEIVIINPTFGGAFDPAQLRATTSENYKLVAIETGLLDHRAAALYDGSISINDDLNAMAAKITSLTKEENTPSDEVKETLSQREKEIIILVVKGLTNKEIAEKLFLSVHTVITHRRNIARKLEIHSSTGLTIYAIVNQLVDLSEIRL